LRPRRLTVARSLRWAAGISTSEMARQLGVSAGALANVEAGTRKPSDKLRVALEARYGLPMSELTRIVETK
jgi:transcriptional regulator with XRE-family HTH domain